MKKILTTFLILIFVLLAQTSIFAAMDSDNYQIWSDAFSVGGGQDQTSDNYTLQDTVGQDAIGIASSTNYTNRAGYRYIEYFSGDPSLTLSVGSNSIALGELETDATKSGTHSLTVGTNSFTGISVTFSGTTLTCSACSSPNTVTAMGSSAQASSVGSSQFGFNVTYVSGDSPSASAVAPYNTTNMYAFSSGDEIISSSADINDTVFTVKYVANIEGTENDGDYSTTITYTALANF